MGPESPGLTVFLLALIAAGGLALGSVRVRGISLGIGGVLFAGLAFGYLFGPLRYDGKPAANPHVLEFAREFGLILFVYTIGVQVGPGFLSSLRRHGLPLNLMAASIILLGVLVTILVHKVAGVELPVAVGLFSGGTTNTPSLAAAQEAMKSIPSLADAKALAEAQGNTSTGYAIGYPFGIIGIIISMILLRVVFRVKLSAEAEELKRQQESAVPLTTMNIEVRNPNLDGMPIGRVPAVGSVVISRVMHQSKLQVARPETVLSLGDVLLAVGRRDELDELRVIVGAESKMDLAAVPSAITTRRILVTKSDALGKPIDELNLVGRFGVTITRVRRGEVELTPSPAVHLHFGDQLLAVGEEAAIKQASQELGDSLRQLNHPQIIPIFVGLALGVILGSLPLKLGSMTAPVKLGLAGGPLVVAIILSRLGNFGPLVWYLPTSANFILRELGIVLFLSCVGYSSGGRFVESLRNGSGVVWLGYGALITLVPLLVVGVFARVVMKQNYMSLCGLLAGSMTDPPALAFAGTITQSDSPSIAYAMVYPTVMLLRVIAAQIMVLGFMR